METPQKGWKYNTEVNLSTIVSSILLGVGKMSVSDSKTLASQKQVLAEIQEMIDEFKRLLAEAEQILASFP